MKGTYYCPTQKSELWKMFRSESLQRSLNRTPQWNISRRNRLLKKLFGSIDGNTYLVQLPFYTCYGCNIHVGKNFFANWNCVLMDHAPITIGDNVMLGPNVSILTTNHPISKEDRRVFQTDDSFHPEKKGLREVIAPVTIGDDVWVGTGAVILPGVTIGSGTVIAAGSVVTHDIPENVLAAGVPCKVLRELTDEDTNIDRITALEG